MRSLSSCFPTPSLKRSSRSFTVSFERSSFAVSKMMCPLFIMKVRFPSSRADCMLCVIIMQVKWCSAIIDLVRFSTFSAVQDQELQYAHQEAAALAVDGRHYKSKSLTLSAREKSDRLMHAIFKSHIQRTELFTKQFLFFFAYVREPAAFGTCESHIFFNGHARSSAAHGILKQMTDFFLLVYSLAEVLYPRRQE